jgi:hypothetical protein
VQNIEYRTSRSSLIDETLTGPWPRQFAITDFRCRLIAFSPLLLSGQIEGRVTICLTPIGPINVPKEALRFGNEVSYTLDPVLRTYATSFLPGNRAEIIYSRRREWTNGSLIRMVRFPLTASSRLTCWGSTSLCQSTPLLLTV